MSLIFSKSVPSIIYHPSLPTHYSNHLSKGKRVFASSQTSAESTKYFHSLRTNTYIPISSCLLTYIFVSVSCIGDTYYLTP